MSKTYWELYRNDKRVLSSYNRESVSWWIEFYIGMFPEYKWEIKKIEA